MRTHTPLHTPYISHNQANGQQLPEYDSNAQHDVTGKNGKNTSNETSTIIVQDCTKNEQFADVASTIAHDSGAFGANAEVVTLRASGLRESFDADVIYDMNQRYMLDAMLSPTLALNSRLAFLADMKAGKTYGTATAAIRHRPTGTVTVLVNPAKTLCSSTAARSAEMSGCSVLDYRALGIAVATPDAIVTTLNSLPKVERFLKDRCARIGNLIFDESEHAAEFMATGTLPNKAEVASCIRRIDKTAANVWLLDAHMGAKSKRFADTYLSAGEFALVKNHYQPWSGWTYSWTEGKQEGIDLLTDYLKQRSKTWVTSCSTEFLGKLHAGLEAAGALDGLRVLRGYPLRGESETADFVECKKDNSKFNDYDVVFISPSGGVGLSIEGEHFERLVSFNIHDAQTPDAVSTLQYLFRTRDLTTKHLDLVYVDQSERKSIPNAQQNKQDAIAYMEQYNDMQENVGDPEVRRRMLTRQAQSQCQYEMLIANERAIEFESYRQIIDERLVAKGIKLMSADIAPVADVERLAVKESADVQAARLEAAIIAAPYIDDEEASRIRGLKRAGLDVDAVDAMALEQYSLRESLHFGSDRPTPAQLSEYLELRKQGVPSKCNNFARASLDRFEIKKLQAAMMNGVGDKQLYKTDEYGESIVWMTAMWRLDRVLYRLAGAERIGDVFTLSPPSVVSDKLLTAKGGWDKGHSYVAELSKAIEGYNATKPDNRLSKYRLGKEPTEVVRELLDNRLGIETKKVYKKPEFEFTDSRIVVDTVSARIAARGSFGVLKKVDAINAIELLQAGGDISDAICSTLELHRDDAKFLRDQLPKLSRRIQKSSIAEYLRKAQLPRVSGDRLSPIARANLYLLELCESSAATA